MFPAAYNALIGLLLRDEGERFYPYDDATGKALKPGDTVVGNITIAVGVNLSAGISTAESAYLSSSRRDQAVFDLQKAFPLVLDLDSVRQAVLASMCFNVGIGALAKFVKMWAAIRIGDWNTAADEMLNSDAAKQDPARYGRLATALRTGQLGGE